MKIVVVGGGPSGLAAACCAAESGAEVTLVDDNPQPGGQIWRGMNGAFVERLRKTNAQVRTGSRVVFAENAELLIESQDATVRLPYDKLIVATGSRELFLPFPGWTLPGVTGAGGLQALVKSGLNVAGKRVVIGGTGPLLMAVAANLSKAGARVVMIAEQVPWSKLIRFGIGLPMSKKLEAFKLRHSAYSPETWVTRAFGERKLEGVTVQSGSRSVDISCDYLAIGYGLISNDEVLQLLRCEASPVNQYQQTSDPNIYAAGEVTGVGGVDLSLVEGTIAGYAAAGREEQARAYLHTRDRWRSFAGKLAKTFALRPELKRLAEPTTIICRCEDVKLAQLTNHTCWREAKLQTRCGMGPCQGRVCGPITRQLFGWDCGSVRPPLFPADVGSFVLGETSERAKIL